MGKHDERDFARECAELRAGRSVCINKPEAIDDEVECTGGCVLDGVGTKTKAIVEKESAAMKQIQAGSVDRAWVDKALKEKGYRI